MIIPDVSIVIVVKNDPAVRRTLELTKAQVTDFSREIIVVDASSDDALHEIRRDFPDVRWLKFEGKKRFTINEQRNLGVESARADIVVFIDSACDPDPGWLQTIVHAVKAGENIVCGPCRASNKGNLVKYLKLGSKPTYLAECTTINVAFRRSVFDKIGRFDTGLAYGGDVDFFWRAVDSGYRLFFEPRAGISHDYGGVVQQIRRAYRYGKARAILHRKHWRTRTKSLAGAAHIWSYPLFIVGLPLSLMWSAYPLLIIVPLLKNRSPKLVFHHLIFGWGVLVGLLTRA
jgi:glycosyltransferase involved in cell wall biosynthesis